MRRRSSCWRPCCWSEVSSKPCDLRREDVWVAVLVLAVGGYVVAYSIWYGLMQRYRVDQVMPFALLMPVVGHCGAVFLGERLSVFRSSANDRARRTGVWYPGANAHVICGPAKPRGRRRAPRARSSSIRLQPYRRLRRARQREVASFRWSSDAESLSEFGFAPAHLDGLSSSSRNSPPSTCNLRTQRPSSRESMLSATVCAGMNTFERSAISRPPAGRTNASRAADKRIGSTREPSTTI